MFSEGNLVTNVRINDKTEIKSSERLNLDRINATMKKVFDCTGQAIMNLGPNEHISLKGLTRRVSSFLGLPQSTCTPFVSMFVRQDGRCTLKRGPDGGVYRGTPAKKADPHPRCQACGQRIRARKTAEAINPTRTAA